MNDMINNTLTIVCKRLTRATIVAISLLMLLVNMAYAQVNINTADASALTGLQGIGEKKAQAIVEYRKKNGKFKSVEELANVPGIGEKTVQSLAETVTVDAPKK